MFKAGTLDINKDLSYTSQTKTKAVFKTAHDKLLTKAVCSMYYMHIAFFCNIQHETVMPIYFAMC